MKNSYATLIMFAIIGLSANVNAQWIQTSLDSGTITSLTIKGDTIFAGTWSDGIYLSDNNGSNWSETGFNHNITVTSLVTRDSNVFAGSSSGLFLYSNTGNNWKTVNTGLPDAIVNALAVKKDTLFAGFYHAGIYMSPDSGNNWSAINTGLSDTNVYSFAIKGNTIFAGTDGGVYSSLNNGNSWDSVNTGLSAHSLITALAINGDIIFAGWSGWGIYLSSNNGSNWTAENTGMGSSDIEAFAISDNKIFVAAYWGGVFFSSNNGSTWAAMNTGFTDSANVQVLAVKGDTLFAGTDGHGVWKRPLSEIITGIKEINNNAGNIAVYPNPATNMLTIDIPKASIGSEQESVIEITNIQGQLMESLSATGNKTNIDVSALPNGVYIMEVKTGNEIEVKKIVKE